MVAASQFSSDAFRTHNVVYLGLFSGMGLLEDVNFTHSALTLGASYDELIDSASGRRYVSNAARNLASSGYYRDYSYLGLLREPGGALVAVVAGARDTGLRGLATIAARAPRRSSGAAPTTTAAATSSIRPCSPGSRTGCGSPARRSSARSCRC